MTENNQIDPKIFLPKETDPNLNQEGNPGGLDKNAQVDADGQKLAQVYPLGNPDFTSSE